VTVEEFKQWAQRHLQSGSADSRKLSVQVSFVFVGTSIRTHDLLIELRYYAMLQAML